MAESKKKKTNVNPLIGAQAQPTTLEDATKIDIDITKSLADNIIEAGLSSQINIGELERFTSMSNAREQMYQLIDTMMQDSSVSSIVRTYAEDICEPADNGHIMWCESDDPNISKFVNYLLDVMNVDKHIFQWAYNLIEYGDVYLKLYRESDYKDPLFKVDAIDKVYGMRNTLNEELNEAVNLNIHKTSDPYSYYIEMVPDPCTMYELTKYGKTYGYIETPNAPSTYLSNEYFVSTDPTSSNNVYNYRMKSGDVNVWQADDYVHAFLSDTVTRFPETIDIFTTDKDYQNNTNAYGYTVRRGKSLIYDSYKIWRQKTLLENAVLLNRLTRSSVIRKVSVEVGDMSKEQVQKTLRRVKELFEQKSALDTGKTMSEYVNAAPIENTVYFATHGGQGTVTVDSVGGDVNVKDLADLDSWINKFYSSYGIPKQYFGWTDDGAGFNGGSSLTILSSVYAKGVKRGQNALIQAVTDAINLILINKGYRAYINNFVLKMKTPVTQEEKDFREDLTNRVSAISNMQSLLSDVEDKSRKLKIAKEFISTLNYGDEILQIIDEEIEAAEKAKQEEAEKAAAEEAAAAAEETSSSTSAEEEAFADDTEADEAGVDESDLDLAPMPDSALEGFKAAEGTTSLTEGADLMESDDLPSPEDLGKDFTVNN